MPRRPTAIRFDDWTHQIIAAEAQHVGVSFADFVRSASLAAAVLHAARRESATTTTFPEIFAAALKAVGGY